MDAALFVSQKLNMSAQLCNASFSGCDSLNASGNVSPTALPSSDANVLTLGGTFGSVMVAVLCLIIVVALTFNVLLILMIVLVKRLHTVSHVLIINLAVGDLILLLAVAFDVDHFMKGYFAYNTLVCEIYHTAFFLSLPASAVNLCLLTGERYFTLKYALQRQTVFNKRRIFAILFISWLYIVVTATLPVMGWRPRETRVVNGSCEFFVDGNFHIFMLVCNFFIPLLIILILNVKIFTIANESVKRLNTMRSRKRCERTFTANVKAAKRILLLVGLFLLCWLTFILTVVVNIVCQLCVPRELSWAVNALNYSSSAINPVLYGLLNRDIRTRSWNYFKRALRSCGLVDATSFQRTHRGTIDTLLYSNGEPSECKRGETSL